MLVCVISTASSLSGCGSGSGSKKEASVQSIVSQIATFSQSPLARGFAKEIGDAIASVKENGVPDEPILFTANLIVQGDTGKGALAAFYVGKSRHRSDASGLELRVVPISSPRDEAVYAFDLVNPEVFIGCLEHVGVIYEFVDFRHGPEVSSKTQEVSSDFMMERKERPEVTGPNKAAEGGDVREERAERLVMILPLSFLQSTEYKLFIRIRDRGGRSSNELRVERTTIELQKPGETVKPANPGTG